MPLSIKRIDEEIEKRSLLKHPFYQMWSHGELTREQLMGYSREYYQLVKVVPGLVSNIASHTDDVPQRRQIEANLQEELGHVEPWARFASALGVRRDELDSYAGAPGTLESIRELSRLTGSSFQEGIAAMYAYEKQLPEISRSKIDGLKSHYGLTGGDATHYFELHEEADVRHAAAWRGMLLSSEGHGDEDSIMQAAVDSLKAQNALLDSVVANYC
jgi:pyrroloquinoline-quinone synthase